jgi:hypothetical protein
MYSHDNELESPGRRAETPAPTDQQTTDLDGRAAASRRVGALDAAAVMHLQASAGNASEQPAGRGRGRVPMSSVVAVAEVDPCPATWSSSWSGSMMFARIATPATDSARQS